MNASQDLFTVAGVPQGRVDEYLGAWAIHEETFHKLVGQFSGPGLKMHVEMAREQAAEKGEGRFQYEVRPSGVAVIELMGTMMKQESSFGGTTSTVVARRKLRHAARNPDVQKILLHVDSPGGTVSGTAALAHDFAMAAALKTAHTYFEDMGASAAYWVGCQGRRVTANETCLSGSIGVLSVLYDTSAAYEKAGVKVHVIKTGEFKGTGTSGAALTEQQLSYLQTMVDGLNDRFLRSVAAGRRVSLAKVREWADGRVHVGPAALELGLVDAIGSFDDALEALEKAAAPRKRDASSVLVSFGSGLTADISTGGQVDIDALAADPIGAALARDWRDLVREVKDEQELLAGTTAGESANERTAAAEPGKKSDDPTRAERSAAETISGKETLNMSGTTQSNAEQGAAGKPAADTAKNDQPATLAELEKGLPAAKADFLLAQLKAGATLAVAKDAFIAEQQKALDAAGKENEQLKAKQTQAPTNKVLGTGKAGDEEAAYEGDAEADFNKRLESLVAGGMKRQAAVLKIAAEDPELHQAYVESVSAAANAAYPAGRGAMPKKRSA